MELLLLTSHFLPKFHNKSVLPCVSCQSAGVRRRQQRAVGGDGEPSISKRDPAAARRGVGAGGRDHDGPDPQVRHRTHLDLQNL